MKNSVSFFSVLRAEHFKAGRNLGVWLMLIFPLVVTIGIDIHFMCTADDVPGNPLLNPWITILGRIFQFHPLLYPMVAAIFCYSLCDMEYKNNGFKQLFTLPISKKVIHFAKVFLIVEVIFLSLLVAFLTFLISGYLMSVMFPWYGFQDHKIIEITLIYFFRIFIGLTAVCMIQYTVSLLFKNFALPLGIACFTTILSLILSKWEHVDFIPYHAGWKALFGFGMKSTELLGLGMKPLGLFSRGEYISLAYTVLLVLVSYFVFRRIKI